LPSILSPPSLEYLEKPLLLAINDIVNQLTGTYLPRSGRTSLYCLQSYSLHCPFHNTVIYMSLSGIASFTFMKVFLIIANVYGDCFDFYLKYSPLFSDPLSVIRWKTIRATSTPRVRVAGAGAFCSVFRSVAVWQGRKRSHYIGDTGFTG